MANIGKVLRGSGWCLLGVTHAVCGVTIGILSGPYKLLNKDLRFGHIFETTSDYMKEGIGEIQEGINAKK